MNIFICTNRGYHGPRTRLTATPEEKENRVPGSPALPSGGLGHYDQCKEAGDIVVRILGREKCGQIRRQHSNADKGSSRKSPSRSS